MKKTDLLSISIVATLFAFTVITGNALASCGGCGASCGGSSGKSSTAAKDSAKPNSIDQADTETSDNDSADSETQEDA